MLNEKQFCITSPRVAPLELNPLFVGGSYKEVAPTELKRLPCIM